MAFIIRPKRSNVAGKVPGQNGEAEKFSRVGEIAINMKDQVIYVRSPDSDLDSDLGQFEKGVKVAGRTYVGGRGVRVDSTAGKIHILDSQTFDAVTLSNDSDQRIFASNEAVSRAYVDRTLANGGLNIHRPVEIAWDSDINAFQASSETVAAFNLSDGDRVLVVGPRAADTSYGQTYAGIYEYNSSNSPIALQRAREDRKSVV